MLETPATVRVHDDSSVNMTLDGLWPSSLFFACLTFSLGYHTPSIESRINFIDYDEKITPNKLFLHVSSLSL